MIEWNNLKDSKVLHESKAKKNMEPLFDKDCALVGWIDPGTHIFDTDMN